MARLEFFFKMSQEQEEAMRKLTEKCDTFSDNIMKIPETKLKKVNKK